ncbi:MAG: hypothetical protein NUV68_04740 [Caldiserica bacterium]|jgi:hypothetical protein|nr:hypothetical protein [Caldisericota bacterium]MDH7562641.1 hypothetical protein [Caldisericota bacterium]
MKDYLFLMDFFSRTLSLEKWSKRIRGLIWGLALFALFVSLLFMASRLVFPQMPIFLFAIPLLFLLIPVFQKPPDPLSLFSKVDQNLKMNERLVTSFEVLKKGGPRSSLEALLLQDAQMRIKEVKPKDGLPREGAKGALVMIMISLIIFSASPFLPQIQFGGNPLQGWISQASSILEELSFLSWPMKEQAFIDVLKAKALIEQGNLQEAVINLQEARELVKDALEKDALTQKELEGSGELSFLTWSLENKSPSELLKMGALENEERVSRAQAIEEKLKALPEGPLRSSLEELVSSLKSGGKDLEEAATKILGVKEKEQSAYSAIDNLISQLGNGFQGEGIGDAARIPPEGVEPGQGVGTRGGISTEREEDQKSYVKSPYTEEGLPQNSLVYLPPSFSGGKGEPLVLPQDAEGKFQVFLPGESLKGSFYDFREAKSSIEKIPGSVFFRQALPPYLDLIVENYFHRLEVTP